MYKKILLPLDSSDLAEIAIPHARAAALAYDASIHLIQVLDPADHTSPLLRHTIERIGNLQEPDRTAAIEGWRAAAQDYLQHIADQLRDAGVTAVTTQVAEGNPYTLISQQTLDEACDLVVIATNGRSGLGRALIGSVADHVIRNTPSAAVLVIRPDA
jgi:nucleotide-binding universal stress UspA family protein